MHPRSQRKPTLEVPSFLVTRSRKYSRVLVKKPKPKEDMLCKLPTRLLLIRKRSVKTMKKQLEVSIVTLSLGACCTSKTVKI